MKSSRLKLACQFMIFLNAGVAIAQTPPKQSNSDFVPVPFSQGQAFMPSGFRGANKEVLGWFRDLYANKDLKKSEFETTEQYKLKLSKIFSRSITAKISATDYFALDCGGLKYIKYDADQQILKVPITTNFIQNVKDQNKSWTFQAIMDQFFQPQTNGYGDMVGFKFPIGPKKVGEMAWSGSSDFPSHYSWGADIELKMSVDEARVVKENVRVAMICKMVDWSKWINGPNLMATEFLSACMTGETLTIPLEIEGYVVYDMKSLKILDQGYRR